MLNEIWIFLVQREGQITKPSIQLISLAKKIAENINAVVIGDEVKNLSEVSRFGIKNIYHLKNNNLNVYSISAYKDLLTNFISENNVKTILFPNNSMIKDFLPRVAVKMEAALAMDCVDLEFNENLLVATRPIYAGKALAKVKANTDLQFYCIRPNTYTLPDEVDFESEIITKEITEVDISTKVAETIKKSDKVDLTEAEIIVSGGRGMKGPENFGMLEELASLINAAVGASRPVCDSGWRPHSDQVGQTGKTVSPKLYIAVGISGAIQHQAGMRSSKYIVAINKDSDAPIFQLADYGISGDAFEIVPAMIEELKKRST